MTRSLAILFKLTALALGAMLSTSCGGGDQLAGGGIGGTGISQGPVTGFGSIFVNGVEFATDSASITLNDKSATESDLKHGMLVKVYWDDSTGVRKATHVVFDDDVIGPLANLSGTAPDQSFSVLGLDVVMSASTYKEGWSTGALENDDIVAVSGLLDTAGVLRATRVEKVTAGSSTYEIKGQVTAVTLAANNNPATFSLGTVVINNSLNHAVTIGDCVEVQGTGFDTNNNYLIADHVSLEDSCHAATMTDKGEMELSGYVSRIDVGAGSFVINGVEVRTTGATVGDNRLFFDISTLTLGGKVEVEGKLSAGVLTATKVYLHAGDLELYGQVSAVVRNNNVITAITLLGQTITVTAETVYEGGLDPATIQVGDALELRAYRRDLTTLTATRIEAGDSLPASNAGEIEGLVEGFNAGLYQLTVGGITIRATGTTDYRNAQDVAINAAQFFNSLVVQGSLVEVEGTLSGNVFYASLLKLED